LPEAFKHYNIRSEEKNKKSRYLEKVHLLIVSIRLLREDKLKETIDFLEFTVKEYPEYSSAFTRLEYAYR